MTQSISSFPKDEERASLFASFQGSVSVEAALVLPIFFLAVCCLCYLLEIMSVQSYVRAALHEEGRKIAKQAYAVPFVSQKQVEEDLVEYIGAERLERSIVKEGSRGLRASGTNILPGTGLITMHVTYKILLPISMFGNLTMECEDSFRIKGWNGYFSGGMFYTSRRCGIYHREWDGLPQGLSLYISGAFCANGIERGGRFFAQ